MDRNTDTYDVFDIKYLTTFQDYTKIQVFDELVLDYVNMFLSDSPRVELSLVFTDLEPLR